MKTFLLEPLRGLMAMLIVLCSFQSTTAQTYTTIGNGNWNSPSVWLGGTIPPAAVTASQTVNIRHQVNFNLDAELKVYGKLNITGGTLQFPSTYSKRTSVFSGGQLMVLNGSFLQSTADRNSDVYADGGRMRFENSVIKVGKAFIATSGSRRIFKNSTIQVGEGYHSQGSSGAPVYDTIQYSTVEVSVAGGGHFEAKDHCHTVCANANILVYNGDFKTADQASLKTLSFASDNYALNKLKVAGHLDNAASWIARVYSYCIDGDIKGSKAGEIDFVRAEDCSLPPPPPSSNSGQLVINEVYTDPNAGNHEFFELYNLSNQAESLDNYTLVSFFKTDTEKGFYVMDMPALLIEPKTFFVGAAAFPFNYQGQTSSLSANFNWNALNASTNGYITKWVHTTIPDISDGNLHYNAAPLPAGGLNDFFARITGDNSFTMFLYKNGMLINRIIAGSGGNGTISSLVTSMPSLSIDMFGSAPDFSINFLSMVGIPVENIVMDAGSDNGFIRGTDGGCGTWKKSSSSVNHTPLQANGPLTTNSSGAISISSTITKGTAATGSTVTFTVTSSNNVFPVELRVYVDNGAVPRQFDVTDSLVDTKTATASGQTFTSSFRPFDADVLIVVRQASGCIDHIKFTPQASFATLPVAFQKLSAGYINNSVLLSWKIADPDEVNHFIVQRSTDQSNFKDIAYVMGSSSLADYEFKDLNITTSVNRYYYRIKAISKDSKIVLSNICVVRLSNNEARSELSIYPNPVTSDFSLLLPHGWQGKKAKLEILSANGAIIKVQMFNEVKTHESIQTTGLLTGVYLLRVICGEEVLQKTLIKN